MVGFVSGKDVEPVAAFFPSIDRNLMRDLDRHLRGPQADPPPQAAPPTAPVAAGHVDISGVLEAVEHAASSMSAMAERIQELEAHSQALEAANHEIESHNRQLATQLDDATQQRDAMSANLKAESDRVQRLESLAAHHVSRATGLERDLGVARADLAKVVDAITHALGAPVQG